MQSSVPVETDIVLLGAGHAHVEVLRRFAMRPEPGVRLTLIGREPETPYSGMLPGLIRGDYTYHEAHIDLAPLAAMANARLIVAEATAFNPDAHTVSLPNRPEIAFDFLSVDVGGIPVAPQGAGIGVKPIGLFLDRLRRLEVELPAGARVAVVGGGPGGVELALALAAAFRQSVAPGAGLRDARPTRRRPRHRAACGAAGVGRRRSGIDLRRHRHRAERRTAVPV